MALTLSIKDGTVTMDPMTEALLYLVGVLGQTVSRCGVSLVITCAREGHPATDPHSRGQALDVSVHNLSAPMIVRVKGFIESLLGPTWTVLFECPPTAAPTVDEPQLVGIATINPGASARHIHMQPKKGTAWPPVETAVKA
jgi:hypothetical protein